MVSGTPKGGKRTLPDLPPELTTRLPKPGQRLSTAALRQLIRDLCGWQPLRGEELATLLHKDLKYLRNKHLTEIYDAQRRARPPRFPSHPITRCRPIPCLRTRGKAVHGSRNGAATRASSPRLLIDRIEVLLKMGIP